MHKILFMTNIIRRMGVMQQTLEQLQSEGKAAKDSACCWITDATEWSGEWEKKLSGTDMVIMKWMGTGMDTPFLRKTLSFLKQRGVTYYIDAAGTDEEQLVQGLTPGQVARFVQYNVYGGEDNYYALWQYADACLTLNRKEGDVDPETAVPGPKPVHWAGIFHPDAEEPFTDLAVYEERFCKPDRPSIGMLFYRDEWIWKDLEYQTAIIREIEKQGMNVVCVFTNGMPSEEMGMPSLPKLFNDYFCHDGVPFIGALLNVLKFSLTGSGAVTIDALKQWDIPVLEAYTLMTPYKEWKDNLEGMNAIEVSISVTMPEFDGTTHGLPVANKKILENGDVRYVPNMERIPEIVRKAGKWAMLRRKENKDKKIAIIFHNYPPRNSNIGSGLGLDTIESIRRVLKAMKERGYTVDFIPEDGKEFIKILTSHATNDRAMLTERQLDEANKIKAAEYRKYYDSMEKSVREQLRKDWEDAPGSVMEYDGSLLVPGTMDGNVLITVQPPRGFGEDPEKTYHSPFCAPTHHYLAFYQWVRDIWQADAVAHIGTHGSLEWLPGKNAGLSGTCYPFLALRDLPNIYPYNMTITGEGIQAKRRGAAVLIEHLPAPQSQAGTYEELEELEKLLDEYVHFQRTQPENLPKLAELVRAKAQEANLDDEVPYDGDLPFDDYILALHNYVTDLKNMEVHTGLHILGQPPEEEGLTEYLWLLTRLDNGAIPSLNQTLASMYGSDYYYLLENSAEIYEPLGITNNMLIDRIIGQSREILALLQEKDFSREAVEAALAIPWVKEAGEKDPAFRERVEKVCGYICGKIYPNLMLTTQEQENMLRGFEGGYVEPGPSGAPSSGGADLLPTGRNFFGIDPRTLPTQAAWEIGMALGDQVIERFIAEEGHYPENIGIILWSGANMRSHGQCIAEFLYLMGLKPVWQPGSLKVTGLEVIPLGELKRPRIDVTARISGLFRDAMPSAAELLDRAVLKVAALEEDTELNFIRKHVLEDSREIQEEEGLTHEDAWRQAAFRIFGDEPGAYGAGVSNLLESKNWESIDDLADVYVRWGGHAYGGKTRGKFLPKQFRKRMGSLDITIKNEDNHETNMLSSDDYNAYHGGMIAAVRSIKGSAPRSYCGDSSDRSRVTMHSVQEQAKRIFRSEAVNPKFISGMMEHGYKGAADMANYLAHSFQWDATSAVMEDWMYEKYAEKYTFDPKVQEWLRDVNPWALQRMTETLLEASQRGLWKAKPETLEELQKLYLDVEGELEDKVDED